MNEAAEIATEHPHIVRKPGTCGGSPIIRGTRITVRHIAFMWKAGETVEDIVRSYSHLKPAWVHDAISYYLDHRDEIEQELKENTLEHLTKKYGVEKDEKGFIRLPVGKVEHGE